MFVLLQQAFLGQMYYFCSYFFICSPTQVQIAYLWPMESFGLWPAESHTAVGLFFFSQESLLCWKESLLLILRVDGLSIATNGNFSAHAQKKQS